MMALKHSICAVSTGSMLLFFGAFLAAKSVKSSEGQPRIDLVFVEEFPDYVTEDRKVRVRQDVGVDQPAPKYAGMIFLVKKSGGGEPSLYYVDERGWANAVYRDGDGNYYFMLRDDVSDEHIYMRPNGKFPYIEVGKRENAALADAVLSHSRSVTQVQLDQCLEQVKQGMLDPSSLILTTSLAADEEQVRDAPRRGLVFSSEATARDHWGDIVPAKISCYFRIEGANPEFSNGYLSPPTLIFTPSFSYERGTAQEAQALLEKAIARYKEVGATQSLAEINDGRSFVVRDLYVVVVGPDNKVVANGASRTAVGETMLHMKDGSGKLFGDEILAATTEGNWVDYVWRNHVNRKWEHKSSLAKRVDDYIFVCGYYRP